MWSCWPSALLYMQKNARSRLGFSADTDGWSQISHFSTYFSGNLTFLLILFSKFTDEWLQFSHFSTYFSGNLTFLLNCISGIYGRMVAIFPLQYVFCRKSDSPPAHISGIYGRMASISPIQYVFCWKSSLSSSPDNLLRLSASGYWNTASLLPDDGRYAQNFLSAV